MLKIFLVHFKIFYCHRCLSSCWIYCKTFPSRRVHWESSSPASIACFGWLMIMNRNWTVYTLLLDLFCYLSLLSMICVIFFSPNKVVRLRWIVLLIPFHPIVYIFPLLISCWWVWISIAQLYEWNKRSIPLETIKWKTR